jgi:hypothetical protein
MHADCLFTQGMRPAAAGAAAPLPPPTPLPPTHARPRRPPLRQWQTPQRLGPLVHNAPCQVACSSPQPAPVPAPRLPSAGGRPGRLVAAAAAAAASPLGGGGGRAPGDTAGVPALLAAIPLFGPMAVALSSYISRVRGLWRAFLPMLSLFFLLSFVNTLLDSLKDTLVITAAGGGAAVVPFLTVYAVLPSSLLFLLAYSWASQRMGRAALFNAIVVGFGAFFTGFAFFLMPNADTLHLHELADGLQQVGPGARASSSAAAAAEARPSRPASAPPEV